MEPSTPDNFSTSLNQSSEAVPSQAGPKFAFTTLENGKFFVCGCIDPTTEEMRGLTADEMEFCKINGWPVIVVPASISPTPSPPRDDDSRGLFDRPRKIINGGYSKKGELVTPQEAVAIGLETEDAEGIFICDRVDNLVMYHCKDFSLTKDASAEIDDPSEIPNPINASVLQRPLSEASRKRVSAVRGWVVDTNTGWILCRSFSEDSILFVDEAEFMAHDWSSYTLKKCKEGTTIRIYWNGKEWSHSTHRKINCRVSRIPGVEIEVFKLFEQGCPEFNYDLLNKDVVYVFQLVHRDNQVMNPKPVEKPRIYHLASITASHTSNPMQLLDLSSESSKLPGMKYLKPLSVGKAWEVLSSGRCLISQKGYEVVQLATKATERLMEVRGYHLAPYIPPPLMYLRLSTADRPLLESAVPYHLKTSVKVDVMQAYIDTNATKLAFFCGCALQSKLGGRPIPLTKTLKWLINRVILNDRNAPFESVCALFSELILPMTTDNGVTFYRCIRDMEDINSKMLRAQARDPSYPPKKQNHLHRSQNDTNTKKPEAKSPGKMSAEKQGGREKQGVKNRGKQPTIKGNVSITYAADKKSRAKKSSKRQNGVKKPSLSPKGTKSSPRAVQVNPEPVDEPLFIPINIPYEEQPDDDFMMLLQRAKGTE